MSYLYAKQERKQPIEGIKILDVEKIWNIERECNYCRTKKYFCNAVISIKSGKMRILDEPYNEYDIPKIHKGCKYNTENFYNSLVILEKDNTFMKRKKMQQQKSMMWDFSKEIMKPVPKSWYAYCFEY